MDNLTEKNQDIKPVSKTLKKVNDQASQQLID